MMGKVAIVFAYRKIPTCIDMWFILCLVCVYMNKALRFLVVGYAFAVYGRDTDLILPERYNIKSTALSLDL